jgi:NAD(P)-dependent dehydrogenase (short-subunit alcohol dehydrogenase family)
MEKAYLVVGGTTGIGKAIADKLLGEGNTVFIVSRNATSRRAPEGSLFVYDVDATDESADWSFLPEVLDGVVYCGGSINLKPFHRLKNEDFLEDFKVNLLGAVNTVQAALPALKKAGMGSVVLFSTVAVQRGLTFHTSVSAAKGGVEGLTRALSAELAPKIRVNAVAISLTDTPMAERLLSTDAKKEAGKERHPLKRYGTPEDSAAVATFLLGSQSSWITGQVIGVDGGMSAIQNL